MSRFRSCTLGLIAILIVATTSLFAAEHRGSVTFSGLPVPGAMVTATQGDQTLTTIADQEGAYSFPDLRDGTWTIRVEMLGFVPLSQEVVVGPNGVASEWQLKLLPLDEIVKQAPQGQTSPSSASSPIPTVEAPAPVPTTTGSKNPSNGTVAKKSAAAQPTASQPTATPSFQRTDLNAAPATASTSAAAEAIPSSSQDQADLAEKAASGLLINGSVINGASSPFAQNAAFGNNRRGPGSLYNGSLGLIFDNSAFDARPFSLTGQDTAKPSYSQLQGVFTLGGPLRIPHLLRNGGVFFVGYQRMHNRNAATETGLVPTIDQRSGILGAGSVIAPDMISPQAAALLDLYPLPNFTSDRYNYQTALTNATHQDALQLRLNKTINQRNQVWGSFALQRTASDNTNLFGFLDQVNSLGRVAALNWQHRLGQRMFLHFQFEYSRNSIRTTPFFADRQNVSANAGIAGNSQNPADWGPPTLNFASGIAPLSDAQSSFNRNQQTDFSFDSVLYRGRHNFSYGIEFRRQHFDYFGQQDARGTFSFAGTFTGSATGSDFGDFLRGIPDTSSIAFGNADKYFRESVWNSFFTDDWRVSPALTVNAGVRWEYAAPITELFGRLVNLDIAPGFTAVSPVLSLNPVGSITGESYPDSLLRPDKGGIEPRIGLAWRPFPASSTVIRAGYGVYYNTSVYQSIAIQMAQQAPFSKNLSVQNTVTTPLSLAHGFDAPASTPTFGADPNFQVGYTQNWQASIQRDLPGSMVFTATYNGIKGTRGMQEFLPNTYPPSATNPCLACPAGFIFLASNGNSTRESGQVQLRRRLHNGFTATVQYTYSKSTDDSALGGRGQANSVIAQNWLDLDAERGPSTFDQRHLLNLQVQYTTGMGIGGGTLLSGWKGTLLKEWVINSQITAGSGFPLTPQFFAPVPGTGITGPIRPNLTGLPIYAAPTGFFLNSQAYTAPTAGQWGNARRDSITGPSQFSLNASLGRTFRLKDRYSLDLRVDSTNALNHVSFTNFNTTINSAQFGLPTGAAPMRSLQTTLRVRF